MGGGCFRTLHWCAHLGTSRTHRHTLCLNPLTTDTTSHIPGVALPTFPERRSHSPFREGLGVGSASSPTSATGGSGSCGPDVRGPPGGNRRRVSCALHPRRPERALSCPSPPGSQPEASSCALLPTPSLSPSCLWGGAGQLGNSCKAGVEAGLGCPLKQPETVSLSRWGFRGPREGKAGGLVGSSAPPPVHLAGPAESPVDPRSKPPPGFKGHPGERGSGELPEQRRR